MRFMIDPIYVTVACCDSGQEPGSLPFAKRARASGPPESSSPRVLEMPLRTPRLPHIDLFGKPTITAKTTWKVNDLHHGARLWQAIDASFESVDNRPRGPLRTYNPAAPKRTFPQ